MGISVNCREISDRMVDAEVQYHPAVSLQEARDQAALALVIRELLLQEAERLGLQADEEPDLIQALLDREIAAPKADEATCRRYYERNLEQFVGPDLYEASHILFASPPGSGVERAEAHDRAAALIAELTHRPERFAELARSHSQCQSAAQGGALGQITSGETAPEFETFLAALEPGQLCPVPVPTRYGYHVLRLDARETGRLLSFETVREEIAQHLEEHAWRTAVRQYLQILVGRAEIEGIELAGAASPLVQ
ncbi:MAG TPA: peptidylprolyl isomerase [Alphaproteobacteria bacterium]|nr:peptidylprolyl isomerase [Alphaproteobacteria bacterium]